MRDWASSGGAKIERAKEHIAEFESASRAFLEAHPYTVISQFDTQRGELRFVVQGGGSIPNRLASVTADAIHNLRASLDILWHQVWAMGIPGKRKQYFPIVRNAQELKTRIQSVKQPSRKAAVDILLAIKPYDSWYKLLWDLNEIEVRDKHEMPILAAATYKKAIIKFPPDVALEGKTGIELVSELGPDGFLFLENDTQVPLVLSVHTDAGFVTDMECNLTADIAFGKGEILEGKPVLKTLDECADLIDDVSHAFITAGLLR